MQFTIEIPDEMAATLTQRGQDLARADLEALGLEAYRQHPISAYQLRTLFGIASHWDLDAFLKAHEVYDYTIEDFEKDLANIRAKAPA